MFKKVFLFPGQGAQFVGMGQDIADAYPQAKNLYDRASEILEFDLAKICFEGPEEQLNSTVMSQPAIFVTSAAFLEVLKSKFGDAFVPDATAGLSLGEYTALYAAGTIGFEDGVRLVHKRGMAMQEAADATDGGMVSILGLDEEKVNAICEEAAQGDLITGANYNCPGQIVVSGAASACQRAAEIAEKHGAMKAVVLKVAGAFHTEMMQPAADALGKALADCTIQDPVDVRVISNIDTSFYKNANAIREGLTAQLVSPLQWQKCMEVFLSQGVESYYEIGPGRVLTGLMKRIHRKTRVTNLSGLESIDKFLSQADVS